MTSETAIRYFIAVPAHPQSNGAIFGIGTTAEAAIEDAWQGENCGPDRPHVAREEPEYEGQGAFVAYGSGGRELGRFYDEDDAQEAVDLDGFTARECTERLYRLIEANGADANSFSWGEASNGLDDISGEDIPDGLYHDEDGFKPLEADKILPEVFYQVIGGEVYRYCSTGPTSYDCHERRKGGRDHHYRTIWHGIGSQQIDNGTTAEAFSKVAEAA